MTLRLERRFGKWIARDDDAGYYREIKGVDDHLLRGDFLKGLGVEEFIVAGMVKNDDSPP